MGSPTKRVTPVATTLTFPKFWTWLQAHVNCIVRAGTPEVVLFDHDDFHWTLLTEDDATRVVQLARGKELVGELVLFPAEIAYVQVEPGEQEGEFVFDCMIETEAAREVAYHFVMAHGYEADEHPRGKGGGGGDKWTH
ncbi:MAG: serine/threonine protein kinase [Kofleriaceae bacterium]|jgi:hypothetical protein|nr:serine/threonine protein kinase [Kofleriaceae bacterium]MBP9171485.1 serine/threonine protein kinase [Kofleriaceae bacterium]MBP9863417.1 serine/threonine protein kinase [Kofleriaceae bacterium]